MGWTITPEDTKRKERGYRKGPRFFFQDPNAKNMRGIAFNN